MISLLLILQEYGNFIVKLKLIVTHTYFEIASINLRTHSGLKKSVLSEYSAPDKEEQGKLEDNFRYRYFLKTL